MGCTCTPRSLRMWLLRPRRATTRNRHKGTSGTNKLNNSAKYEATQRWVALFFRIGTAYGSGVLVEEFLGNFRKLLADLTWQPVMDAAGVNAGNIRNHHRRRRGNGHDQPHNAEEEESCKGNKLQHQGVAGREVANSAEGDEKNNGGNAGHNHQADIDSAMKHLAVVAVDALDEVGFVVATHLGRQATDVIP